VEYFDTQAFCASGFNKSNLPCFVRFCVLQVIFTRSNYDTLIKSIMFVIWDVCDIYIYIYIYIYSIWSLLWVNILKVTNIYTRKKRRKRSITPKYFKNFIIFHFKFGSLIQCFHEEISFFKLQKNFQASYESLSQQLAKVPCTTLTPSIPQPSTILVKDLI